MNRHIIIILLFILIQNNLFYYYFLLSHRILLHVMFYSWSQIKYAIFQKTNTFTRIIFPVYTKQKSLQTMFIFPTDSLSVPLNDLAGKYSSDVPHSATQYRVHVDTAGLRPFFSNVFLFRHPSHWYWAVYRSSGIVRLCPRWEPRKHAILKYRQKKNVKCNLCNVGDPS